MNTKQFMLGVISGVVLCLVIGAVGNDVGLIEQVQEIQESKLPPIGTVVSFAGKEIPKGWLPCDGTKRKTTEFPELAKLLGETFGAREEEQFTLPDLNGRVALGAGPSIQQTQEFKVGVTGGEELHILTVPEMPPHSHGQYTTANPGSGNIDGHLDEANYQKGASGYHQGIDTGERGGGLPQNNMPPFLVLKYMIKY